MTSLAATYGFIDIPDVETRIARRSPLARESVNALMASDAKTREIYSVKRIAEMQEVWTAWDGDVLPEFEGQTSWVIWCWPDREFAEHCHSSTLRDPRFVPIPLDDFFGDVMANSDSDIGIFPSKLDRNVAVDTAAGFAASISRELKPQPTNSAFN